VLVIGETCTDIFCYGTCDRLEPSAPVPVFKELSKLTSKGMAQLVATNISSLGTTCDVISNNNEDDITKVRYVDNRSNHMFLRVDTNDDKFTSCDLSSIDDVDFSQYEAVVISDYNKGFLSKEVIEYILSKNPITFLDTKKVLGPWATKAKFIKINSEEFRKSKDHIDNSYDDKIIVTLGSRGSRYKGIDYSVENVSVKDVSGAGDTFLAALVTNYLKTLDIVSAIKFANDCSTRVVQGRGMTIL